MVLVENMNLPVRFCAIIIKKTVTIMKNQTGPNLNTPINWENLPRTIIIIMSRHQYGYPATVLYRLSLPVSLQGYILYQHRAVVCGS